MQSIRVVWDDEQEQSVMQALLPFGESPARPHNRAARIAIFKKLSMQNPE